MILVTHAVVGGALGGALNNPAAAFIAGFVSHFLLDAIPHWDYSLASGRKDPGSNHLSDIVINGEFVRDLFKFGLDGVLGLLLPYLFFNSGGGGLNWAVLFGAVGAMFPDFLQFVYFKLRLKPLAILQGFHNWIHAKSTLKDRPVLGILFQVALVLLVWSLGKFLIQ